MKSLFRLYAKTSKGNQRYLYEQLKKFGLDPQYQQQFHSFYFKANYKNLFDLSFRSLGIQDLYIQIGHRFPAGTEKLIKTGLEKLQFKNYLPIQRGLIENITLKILLKECSDIPSQNVIVAFFQEQLNRDIIMKEYKKNILPAIQEKSQLYLFKEIREIVDKKWQHDDKQIIQQKQRLLLQMSSQKLIQQKELGQQKKHERKRLTSQEKQTNLPQIFNNRNSSLQTIQSLKKQIQRFKQQGIIQHYIPYQPNLLFFVRKNQARVLLKINNKEMYKYGWRKSISWGSIRQSIVASAIFHSGLLEQADKQKQLNLWDPFCGSGTIPIVTSSIIKNTKVRQNITQNFTWPFWPVYRQQYLDQYNQIVLAEQKKNPIDLRILGNDINITAVNHSINNFNHYKNSMVQQPSQNLKPWLNLKPTRQIFQVDKDKVYFACQHFQTVYKEILPKNQGKKFSIITNMPYLDLNSKEHMPFNQLVSAYKKFDKMLDQAKDIIQNVYIFISIQNMRDKNHFLRITQHKWELLQQYKSASVRIGFYRWSLNKAESKVNLDILEAQQNLAKTSNDSNEGVVIQGGIEQSLQLYREQVQDIKTRRYYLPEHMKTKRNRGWRSAQEKAKDRHLKLAYTTFSKRRDKLQALQQYMNKKVSLKMMKRGLKWRKKNMHLLKGDILKHEEQLKKEFSQRIQQALQFSQMKKASKQKVKSKRIW